MPGYTNKVRGKSVEKMLRSIAQGLREHFPKDQRLHFSMKQRPASEVLAEIDRLVAPYEEARNLQIAARVATKKRNAMDGEARKYAHWLVGLMEVTLNHDSTKLWKYGIRPVKKRRKATAMEKVAAVTKWRATRKLRGTIGKRQKAKVKAQGEPIIEVRFVRKD